jgi:hypothetical protein
VAEVKELALREIELEAAIVVLPAELTALLTSEVVLLKEFEIAEVLVPVKKVSEVMLGVSSPLADEVTVSEPWNDEEPWEAEFSGKVITGEQL